MKFVIVVLAAAVGLQSTVFATPIAYDAILNGPSEFPPNASPGTGSALVTIDTAVHTLLIQLSFSGLTAAVTAAFIHCCTVTPDTGVAGVAVPLTGFPAATSGTYTVIFDTSMASTFNITFNGGVNQEAALAAGLAAGEAYVNLHTSTFPGGEIRGFLTPEPTTAGLWVAALAALLLVRRRAA